MNMEKQTAKAGLVSTLKLAFGFQLGWIVVAGLCLLVDRPIASHLLPFNLITLFTPAVVELVTRIKLPMALQIHFFVFVTAASFLGSIVGFYDSVPNWDTYVHIDSGVLLAWLGFFVVLQAEQRSKAQLPKWFGALFAFLVPMALASLWEIYEYFSDVVFHTSMQTGGLRDTIIDMVAAVAGALIAIAIAVWCKAPKSVLPALLRST